MYQDIFDRLLDYGRGEDWQGYDPYDGLNSALARLLPNSKPWRIAWIQLFKRLPINLRALAKLPKGENPKGLALFVRALLLAYKETKAEHYRQDAEELLERLWALRSPGYGEKFCWGYNFDWQSRAFFVPAQTPSIVCTTFVAHAWLDHYELFGDNESLKIARSACQFILDNLLRTLDNPDKPATSFCFSYTPLDQSAVHNANLLGAELLGRVARHTHEMDLITSAIASTTFTIERQAPDGSWPYGTAANQQWIDSFHTGFNLVSLDSVIKDCSQTQWQANLQRGCDYYLRHFFLADGTPKYYHNNTYPIDIHAAAQGLVSFVRLKHLIPDSTQHISRVADWTLKHMWDSRGYWYFQKSRLFTNKIPYLRWSQAWMAYALALVIFDNK